MRLSAVIIFALMASVTWAGETKQPVQPNSAVIVIEGIYSREGIAKNNAISIVNPQLIAKLEAFFPKYRDTPSSDLASASEIGYRVYFNLPNGRTLRVSVSENGGGDTWTMVGGDLKTNGDFRAFVEALQGKKLR